MSRLKLTLLLAALCLASTNASGQSPKPTEGTTFSGSNFSFALKEPADWILDANVAREQTYEAAYYPKGSSFGEAGAVMYARVIPKGNGETVEQIIAKDIGDVLKLSKQSKVEDAAALETRSGKKTITKSLYDAASLSYETLAFIDEPKAVIVIVLSLRDKAEYEKAFPAFKALAGSYLAFDPPSP